MEFTSGCFHKGSSSLAVPRRQWMFMLVAVSACRTLLFLAALGFGSIAGTSSALAAAGDLDPDFGVEGKMTTDFTGPDGEDEATVVLEVEDDKIVVVGFVLNPLWDTFDFALARYHADGTLDTSFGTLGRVITPFPGGTNDVANAAVVDDDGKIIVVGSSETLPTCPDPDEDPVVCPENEFKIAIARYNEDGTLDPSFDGDGLVTTIFPGRRFADADAVALDEHDKIVVAGAVGDATIIDTDGSQLVKQPDFALARYNEDGSLDTSFDGDGLVVTNFSLNDGGDRISLDEVSAVAIDDDGKIVVAGYSQFCNEPPESECPEGVDPPSEDFALARYNSDGSLDPSFGSGGLVTTDFEEDFDVANAIALMEMEDDNGGYKIVAAGTAVVGPFDPESGDALTEEDFALVRYNYDGTVDTAFGTFGGVGSGKVVTDFLEGVDEVIDIAIMEDEDEDVEQYKIVAVGVATESVDATVNPAEEQEDFALARYNYDGTLDTAFGVGGDEGDGKVRTHFNEGPGDDGNDEKAAAVIIEDDRIIVAGTTSSELSPGGDIGDFALAVYFAYALGEPHAYSEALATDLEGLADDLWWLDYLDKHFAKAADKLEDGLDAELWSSEVTLTKKGKKVFDKMKSAVKELLKVDGAFDVADRSIEGLVEIAAALAEVAIEDAMALNGDKKKIEKAVSEFQKGSDEAAEAEPDKAIDKFKKAWENAEKAID